MKSGIDSKNLIKGRFRSDYGDGLTTVGHATKEIMTGLLRLRGYVFEHANGHDFHSQAMADITRLDLPIEGTMAGNDCMIDIELIRFGYEAGSPNNRSVTLYGVPGGELQSMIANIPPSPETPEPPPSKKEGEGRVDELVRHFQVYYTLLEDPPLRPRHVPYASPFLNLEGHVETKPEIVDSLLRRLETKADSEASRIRHYPWDILACPGVRFQ